MTIAFTEKQWQQLLADHFEGSIEIVGTLVFHLIAFYVPCGVYASFGVLFPAFSESHKIQPAGKQPTRSEVLECLKVVLRNQLPSFFLQLGSVYLTSGTHRHSFSFDTKLPGMGEVAFQFVVCILLREVSFYYAHRLLHILALYPKIHKFHHRFTAPVALAAQYAHPIEHVFANILPMSLPPQLFHAHIVTFWVFMSFVLFETATVHSEYDFFGEAARKHDLHHRKFMIYFGTIGLLDWWHETDKFKIRAD
ncbi:putative C-4 methylsterol oxidase [Pleurotus eryngii]|uniref:C-4 methylsterol oxidase n=1 Tax=Pleurotus eryngii TaxID=5323 RepID=A0A9P5ZK95_PLEER|nr:putative C-4 methylsterol oxidase [Pleurotus eryngii]